MNELNCAVLASHGGAQIRRSLLLNWSLSAAKRLTRLNYITLIQLYASENVLTVCIEYGICGNMVTKHFFIYFDRKCLSEMPSYRRNVFFFLV